MKVLTLIIVLFCGGLLIYGTLDFPAWGDPASPASTHVSPYYIEKTLEDTSVPNVVTSVLADYRGFDTLFETIVIFTAAVSCFFLLRVLERKAPESTLYRHVLTGITIRVRSGEKLPGELAEFERIDSEWVPYDLIIKTGCRLILPFIQLFALYVIAHGHHSPGGGFQGGVIIGAAMILFAISNNLRSAIRWIGEKIVNLLCSTGVFIYAGTGLLCVFLGRNFLDYAALAVLLGIDPVTARSHGILAVEIGVGIAVMAVVVSLYYNLSSAGKLDEGL
ncbi:MAG: Na(+)/H(+) antiporter subunit B [Deltaproteobacteria bacterium]|nr:Na(+)/H(+) antiporter subunit B [Deltaproteobacteria bacterium]